MWIIYVFHVKHSLTVTTTKLNSNGNSIATWIKDNNHQQQYTYYIKDRDVHSYTIMCAKCQKQEYLHLSSEKKSFSTYLQILTLPEKFQKNINLNAITLSSVADVGWRAVSTSTSLDSVRSAVRGCLGTITKK